jgi:CRISPR-associated protein Cas6
VRGSSDSRRRERRRSSITSCFNYKFLPREIPKSPRIVTIKKFTEPEPFLDAAQRQLTQLGIAAVLEFPRDGHTRSRRIITVHGHKVVGFSLAAHGLNDEDSIKLQSVGLGGRRVMGCGMFNPIVKAIWTQEEDAAEAKEA